MKMKKKALAGAGLAALALVGGTFAYYTAENSLDNPLSTGTYETELVEEFTPAPEDMKPGQKWDKKAGAENTGDYPVLVRIKMVEKWSRKGEGTESAYKTIESSSDLFDNGVYSGGYPDGVFDAAQDNDTDGLTPAEDGTVVYKHILTDAGWVDGGDGYWYWNGVLEKKGSEKSKTTNLLDGLALATDIDLGKYETKEYYAISAEKPDAAEDEKWTAVGDFYTKKSNDLNKDGIVDIRDLASVLTIPDGQTLYRKSASELAKDYPGYSDSNYTLTVTSQFVQATKDAAESSWGEGVLEKMENVKVAADGVSLEN